MSNLFNRGMSTKVKKNVFDLSHERKLSMNMGHLIPMYLQEVVPGDKFKVSTEMLVRLAPMIAPMMHRVNIHTHFFFVPNRLIWNNWQDFITGGPTGQLQPTFPVLPIGPENYLQFQNGSLSDYFGIPPVEAAPTQLTYVNALPYRAYHLIYNEYFRDQTLTSESEFTTGDILSAQDIINLPNIKLRSWEKDYFTSALPWAQRGAEVLIPTVPQLRAGSYPKTETYWAEGTVGEEIGGNPGGEPMLSSQNKAPGSFVAQSQTVDKWIGLAPGTTQDVTSTGSINDLRKAVRLQEWLEKNARAGARYIEQIMAHFGVRSSDARLQRPEFLGGGINPVVVSEVLSTVGTTELPQGNMAGHGISVGHDNNFTKFFEEHGYVIGIVSVMPRTAYQQGIPKPFLKSDRFDFFWPEFANIGEQPVYLQELYHQYNRTDAENKEVFGYQSRYCEYKFAPNSVHGDFRDTMNYWHMGRIFDNPPALNNDFVNAQPTHRVFAVTDPNEHKLYVQIYNKVTAIRPMPINGTPIL